MRAGGCSQYISHVRRGCKSALAEALKLAQGQRTGSWARLRGPEEGHGLGGRNLVAAGGKEGDVPVIQHQQFLGSRLHQAGHALVQIRVHATCEGHGSTSVGRMEGACCGDVRMWAGKGQPCRRDEAHSKEMDKGETTEEEAHHTGPTMFRARRAGGWRHAGSPRAKACPAKS